MGGGDVEAEIAQNARQIKKEAGSVEGLDLDHGEILRTRIVDDDVGRHRERSKARLGTARPNLLPIDGTRARNDFPNDARDFLRLYDLFIVLVIVALEQKRVQGQAIVRGRNLRRGNVRSRGGASPRALHQKPRMIRRHKRKLGNRMADIAAPDVKGKRSILGLETADEMRVLDLPVGIGPEPVIALMPLDEALHLLLRPISKRFPQANFCIRDPRLPRRLRMTARQKRLRIIIEGPQELAFPAVPRDRSNGTDIRDRKQQKKLQPFRTLHDLRESSDGLRIGNVAMLCGLAHDQMVLDKPRRCLSFRWGKPEAQRERAREGGADDAVVAFAGFRHIMHQERKIKRAAILNIANDFRRQRELLSKGALLDLGKDTDCLYRVLVDRVMVIHIELHHRHDAPELGDEAPKDARTRSCI